MSLSLASKGLLALTFGLMCTPVASAQKLAPYVGGGAVVTDFGDFSPCSCTNLSFDLSGGVRYGERFRIGVRSGTVAIGDGQIPVLGLETGLRILPLRKNELGIRRLELRASYAGLLYNTFVAEDGITSRRGGYTHNVDLVWRFLAAQRSADAGWYLAAGRSVVRKRTFTHTSEFPLSRLAFTNIGWRFSLGYSL